MNTTSKKFVNYCNKCKEPTNNQYYTCDYGNCGKKCNKCGSASRSGHYTCNHGQCGKKCKTVDCPNAAVILGLCNGCCRDGEAFLGRI